MEDLIPQGIAKLRERIAELERDRQALQEAGIRTARLDRIIESKRRSLAQLEELAASGSS